MKEWFCGRALRFAEEVMCEDALKIALRTNKLIEEGLVEAPYKIPFLLWSEAILRKLLRDRMSRSSLTKVLRINRRTGLLLLSKLTRETY